MTQEIYPLFEVGERVTSRFRHGVGIIAVVGGDWTETGIRERQYGIRWDNGKTSTEMAGSLDLARVEEEQHGGN